MTDLLKRLAPILLALALGACATPEAPAAVPAAATEAPQGAVSAADPRAEAAGRAILAQGGSATDAAIAVMLALTVVEPQSSGIGGGGFMVRAGEAGVTTFDGRETAPAAATPTRFLGPDGEPLPRDRRVISGLSVGVPGNIALAAKAHAEHGRLAWRDLFAPAIALARDGFVMNRRLHGSLAGAQGRADRSDAARAVFFGADGAPLPVGTRITVPALARTLERIAEAGPEAFYEDGAEALAAYVAGETPQDGAMSAADIASYAAKRREPVCTAYRAHRVCGMGPPSSGGIAVAQILGQLERFDLAELGPESVTFWHLFLESQRLAYADRARYLGDSDFVEVPLAGLTDPAYLARRSALIDPEKALPVAEPGTPPGAPQARADGDEPAERGTSHFAVVDAAGNAVSYTSTIEGAFGSGLFFGGFYLNNELTDFSLTPEQDGSPVANRVEGGKRPRSSMAPTVVYDPAGEIVLVIGAAGGTTIPVQVARSVIGVIDFGLSASEALALPLVMAFGPTVIVEEGSALAGMTARLEALGHDRIRPVSPPLKANALRRTPEGWESARDPRIEPNLAYE
ncbi:gamma-glutamyltransferase [Erythrobacter sp. HL-111]|uniref:gamma-glutamyltransferase n=1 Tax=Erythrobacter sp. HL-111 TaxID=1798193 RepID=UPI0006D9C0A5|nr:gamma-glutamyltransferase [Erythrobacter sp. HL-111]KPP86987.1 MAG: gamma-glutamyltransferase [Erythrobacteraceae bacterium HL-111]SDS77820.1 gamma-glutamyltranspeptidase / glutathione hydrolase [Erythrobacter sp. HL-111]